MGSALTAGLLKLPDEPGLAEYRRHDPTKIVRDVTRQGHSEQRDMGMYESNMTGW